jgi:predicted nuclease with RNAse H fold
VITVGIDLAAEPVKTGVASIEWIDGGANVADVRLGASDDELVTAIRESEKAGIDCPLGWPREFVDFITRHQDDQVEIQADEVPADWRRRLAYRVTDLRVKNMVPGIQGLSVSSDRIGVTTMRCAALQSQLAKAGEPIDRSGSGRVVEVYPAASLVQWGFRHRGYKGPKGTQRRGELIDELQVRAPWLNLGPFEAACRASDDALDAILSSMTARAAALGLTDSPTPDVSLVAASEGWIALPSSGGSLEALVSR